MQKNAIVRDPAPEQKNKSIVIVEPLAFTECAGCAQACKKRSPTVPALNKHNFPLETGSPVIISTSKLHETLESIISLIFPIAAAVAGYALSNPLFRFASSLFKKNIPPDITCPEGIKALIAAVFFAIAAFLVLKITRSRAVYGCPEITDVLERAH